MYKKILFLGLAASLLGGCDTESSDNKLEQVQQAQVAPKASSTAIFLPGGGGIDFYMLPVIDSSGSDASGKPFKSLYYDFSDKQQEKIDQDIDEVLLNQGYIKKERAIRNNKVIKNYLYVKPGYNEVAVQYSEVFKEGFQNNIRVLFWWYEN